MTLTPVQILPRYANVDSLSLQPTSDQADDFAEFKKKYPSGIPRYRTVASAVGIPVALIAALHWREAGGNFNCYLAQGDPLGKPAVNDPTDEPVRDTFEPAAIDSLTTTQQTNAKADLGISISTTDLPSLLAFAEIWNGEGYAERGVPDPYCLAGTTGYNGGKYIQDGVYDPDVHDEQIGVLAMLWFALKNE